MSLTISTLFAENNAEQPLNHISTASPIRDWHLIGPFPSKQLSQPTADSVTRSGFDYDFLSEIGGESAVQHDDFALGKNITVKLANDEKSTRKPIAISSWDNGWVNAGQFSRSVAYASSTVSCDQAGEYYIYCSSHGSPKLWINGERVICQWQDMHHAKPWQHGIKVHLDAGIHHFLLKIDNRRGWFGFQVDLIPAAEHSALAKQRIKKLAISDIEWTTAGNLNVTVALSPPALDIAAAVQIAVSDNTNNTTTTASGLTGTTITIPGLATDRIMTLNVTADPADELFTTLSSKPVSRAVYIGDIVAYANKLGKQWQEHRDHLRQDTPTMSPAIDWIDAWLEQSDQLQHDNKIDLGNLQYLEDCIQAAEQGSNLFRDEPQTAYPCRFTGIMPDGTDIIGEYHVTAPTGFWQQLPDKENQQKQEHEDTLPLLYNLHGAGGTGLRIQPKRASYKPDHYDELEHTVTPSLRILPRATRAYHWKPAWLDLLHAHIEQTWNIDPQRVHLQGFSMGGGGTMAWGLARPELFATLAPMAFSMRWVLGDPPYDDKLMSLKGKPIWLICGGKDKRVNHMIELHQAMSKAGVDVRLSIYGSRGHGGLESLAQEEGLSAWQDANRLPKLEHAE